MEKDTGEIQEELARQVFGKANRILQNYGRSDISEPTIVNTPSIPIEGRKKRFIFLSGIYSEAYNRSLPKLNLFVIFDQVEDQDLDETFVLERSSKTLPAIDDLTKADDILQIMGSFYEKAARRYLKLSE